MIDREKLIELIGSTEYGNGSLIGKNFQQGFIEKIAVHLLTNGVTMQKWIPASKPPEVWRDENGDMVNYLVYMPEYGVDIGNYVEPAKCWLYMGIPCEVTHWMPLPEPPMER